MPTLIKNPSIISAEGNKPKRIHEYIGRVNTETENVSIAHMKSPEGWTEPGQQPEFTEYTIVLKGVLNVETGDKTYRVRAGEAIIVHSGEWVRYSTPETRGAEYFAVCIPAFSAESVHRDK
jgi:quercetin dioxygenase-like cupin family protein